MTTRQVDPPAGTLGPGAARPAQRRPGAVELYTAVPLARLVARGWLAAHTGSARAQTWPAIFAPISSAPIAVPAAQYES